MKKFYRNSTVVAAMVASMFMLSSCEKELDDTSLSASSVSEAVANSAISSKTAQSFMINITAPDVIVVENGEWHYNRAVAATFFTAEKEAFVNSAVSDDVNKCAFFYGGTLITSHKATPLKATVMAGTAWEFIPSSTETSALREVAISFVLASQAVVDNQNQGIKYNFTLKTNEIEELNVKVINEETQSEIDIPIKAENYKIVVGAENPYLYALPYSNNAGTSGKDLELLKEGITMSEILDLNTNDYGTKDPKSEAAVLQLLAPISLKLDNGTYKVVVTGVVDGRDAKASSSFTVSKTTGVVTGVPNCKDEKVNKNK